MLSTHIPSPAPTVSIIIPCYNSESLVGDAIESALSQSYPHVEVIVIDDGSTDNSLRVIRSFGARVRWETGPNNGACHARNRGLRLAQGEFIQYLDADDVLLPLKIERQLPIAMESDRRLVFCEGTSDGDPNPHYQRKDSLVDPVVYMLEGGLPTPAPLHRKDWLIQAGGFREDLPCSQERDLHLRLAATGLQFMRFPETHYFIRKQPGSVSSNIKKILEQRTRILQPVFQDLLNRGTLNDRRRQAFAGLRAMDARIHLKLGCWHQGYQALLDAFQFHPQGGLRRAFSSPYDLLPKCCGQTLTVPLLCVLEQFVRRPVNAVRSMVRRIIVPKQIQRRTQALAPSDLASPADQSERGRQQSNSP